MVAFSGGPDSVCLLHQLARRKPDQGLLAVHVDHGLDHGSARRASLATEIATSLGVECRVERVQVRRSGSIEANARHARYAALARYVESGGILLTAHHANDVAETMLLRLLRGSGPGGLGGIPACRRFGPGWLLRPLLSWRRSQIERYLTACGLQALHDPANDLASMDRNFIRHEIMPLLQERFPGGINGIVRSAALNRAAAQTLATLAETDIRDAEQPGPRLRLDFLRRLDPFRRSEALRRWCLNHAMAPPPGTRLDEFLRQIDKASADRQPTVRWSDGQMRRHGEAIWLSGPDRGNKPWELPWNGRDTLMLPGRAGTLQFQGSVPQLSLRVCSGRRGERIQRCATSGRQEVKKLLADHGVPPWLRADWPRIWSGDRLVALGDHWLDVEFAHWLQSHGGRIVWQSELPVLRTGSSDSKPNDNEPSMDEDRMTP